MARSSPHIRRFLVLWLAALLATLICRGESLSQTTSRPSLDLDAAVEKALASDPQLKIAQTGSRVADAKLAEARSGWKPSVQFSQSFTRSNNPVFVFGSLLEQGRFAATNFALDSLNHPDGLNNFRTSITVRQPLFDQWQTRSNVNRAALGRKRSDLETEAARQRLTFEVVRSYYGAILADELLVATDAAVNAARENCRKTRDMVDVGMVAESDSLVASVELANMEQLNLEAHSAVITARAGLNIAIGENAGADGKLTGRLLEKYFPVEEQSDLIRIALEQRPEYRQAELAIEDGREQTRSVRNQRLPRVDAFGGYGYSSPYIANGSSDYTVGISLSYNIFDAGRKARIEQSAAAESIAELEREKLANKITLEVVNALQSYKTARTKIQVSIKSVSQAEEALRILQDRYRVAISTFDAVLRAEAAVLKAKHDLLQARYEYYISYAAILLATGRMTDVRNFD